VNNRPRFSRSGQTIDCTWPALPYTTGTLSVGGGEESAAGIPSVYVVRWAPLLRTTLRLTEAEFLSLDTFWRATQAVAWTFRTDLAVAGSEVTVYWHEPHIRDGGELTFTRDESDGATLLVPIALRRTTQVAFTVPAYDG
jgi:hypothetical protein